MGGVGGDSEARVVDGEGGGRGADEVGERDIDTKQLTLQASKADRRDAERKLQPTLD